MLYICFKFTFIFLFLKAIKCTALFKEGFNAKVCIKHYLTKVLIHGVFVRKIIKNYMYTGTCHNSNKIDLFLFELTVRKKR